MSKHLLDKLITDPRFQKFQRMQRETNSFRGGLDGSPHRVVAVAGAETQEPEQRQNQQQANTRYAHEHGVQREHGEHLTALSVQVALRKPKQFQLFTPSTPRNMAGIVANSRLRIHQTH